jgi:hypothetical protein
MISAFYAFLYAAMGFALWRANLQATAVLLFLMAVIVGGMELLAHLHGTACAADEPESDIDVTEDEYADTGFTTVEFVLNIAVMLFLLNAGVTLVGAGHDMTMACAFLMAGWHVSEAQLALDVLRVYHRHNRGLSKS